jgi:Type IV secretion system pilin
MNLKYIKNNISSIYFLLSSFLFLVPNVSFAFFGGVSEFLDSVSLLISKLLPITFALSILFFFWGVAQFVLHAGDEKKIKEGKSLMVWGVIAIFVMSSLWGIVKLIGDTFGVETPVVSPSYTPSCAPEGGDLTGC